jgi:hypothetical protein
MYRATNQGHAECDFAILTLCFEDKRVEVGCQRIGTQIHLRPKTLQVDFGFHPVYWLLFANILTQYFKRRLSVCHCYGSITFPPLR